MLSQQTIGFLIERHKNKISLAELLDLYKLKYPNASYIRVARKLFDDLKIKHEPELVYNGDIWIKNPRYNKDYGFNSYFFVEYDQSFLLDYFTVDNGQTVADALNYVINNISYDIVSELEENLNCSARDFLGAYTDVFLDALQLSEKFNISVLKDYKKKEEQTVQNEKNSKAPANSTELQEEKAKNTLLKTENERLKAENAELKAQLQDNVQRQSAVDSESVLENGKATRISKIQRDIFTLLILKNYQGMESRNALFDVINADLKEQGINNKGASYQTFDNLIDENIRLTKIGLDGKQISHSPFPSKITK